MTRRKGIIKKGKLVLEKPLPFRDGTPVRVHVEPINGQRKPRKRRTKANAKPPEAKKGDKYADDPLQFLIDHAVDTGITDWAEEHDHYIYGTPKRSESVNEP